MARACRWWRSWGYRGGLVGSNPVAADEEVRTVSEHQESGQATHAVMQPNHLAEPGTGATPGNPGAQVSEAQARAVAEQAREAEWALPSFGKQLFLGDFQLGLIHPHPRQSEDARRRGEEFCARMRDFCETSVNSAQIERDARIPDETVKGLAAIGAFGMKIPPAFGGLGLTNLYYNRALIIAGSASPAIAAPLSGRQSIGVPHPPALFRAAAPQPIHPPRP